VYAYLEMNLGSQESEKRLRLLTTEARTIKIICLGDMAETVKAAMETKRNRKRNTRPNSGPGTVLNVAKRRNSIVLFITVTP